ncbi:MAG: YdcF family protein [Leptolyngbyaceae cyanobacterium]
MMTLIGCAILWVLWLISPKRTRRWFIYPLMVVIASFVILTSPVVIDLLMRGLTASLPEDTGATVDAIVVLGRGPQYRANRLVTVWELWRSQRAPTIFSSGMLDAKEMVRQLETDGIPPSALAGEECSQTTEENAAFTSAFLRPEGVEDILLVTDPPHMQRSLLVFRSFGFQVIPYPVSATGQDQSNSERLKVVLREYAALAQYAIDRKFEARSPAMLDHPPAEITTKITQWNCQVPSVSLGTRK